MLLCTTEPNQGRWCTIDMHRSTPIKLFMLLWLAVCIVSCTSSITTMPSTPATSVQMLSTRAAHTATLLPDGIVLLTGGFSHEETAVVTTELFNPQTNQFNLSSEMSMPRQSHTATLLNNGTLLIAGGLNDDYLATAELYDPQTGQMTPTGSMNVARSGHTAVLLNDGRVLMVGGVGEGWGFLSSAEIYDPKSETFTLTGSMSVPRESHTATLLATGDVLITGGHQGRREEVEIYRTAEIYKVADGTFHPVADMGTPRHKHDATLLQDGRVLINGGSDARDAQGIYASTELFDPQQNLFQPAATMHSGRYKHTGSSLLLPSGQVLLVGGAQIAELYSPSMNSFQQVAEIFLPVRHFGTATLLGDGRVLFAGGYGQGAGASPQAHVITLPK